MEDKRTGQQNRAFHKYFSLVAEELNRAGYDMKKVIKTDIDFTPHAVKEYLWKPVQKVALGKGHTAELTTKEVNEVYETLNRLLGEKFGIHVPFPSIELDEENKLTMD